MTVPGLARSASEMAGVPMLPPTSAGNPAAVIISPVSVVVVVLPFDPVIATIGPGRNCAASSISPITDFRPTIEPAPAVAHPPERPG